MKDNYTTMQKNGVVYVLRARQRATTHPDANFLNTGLALVGTLLRGQSLNAWMEKKANSPKITNKHFNNLKYSRRAKLNN